MLLAQQNTRPLVDFTLAPLFQEHGIPLAVMGTLVVFIALVLIVMFITLLPRLVGRQPAKPLESPVAVRATSDDELSPELVAVIAAAVAATLGEPHRIVKIRGLTPAELGWSMEGRMQHHQSHRFRNLNR